MEGESLKARGGSVTGALARYIVGYRGEGIDPRALVVAKQCILDWFAVTLAGFEEPVARAVRDEARRWLQGPCTIVGSQDRIGPEAAALSNGTTSHALDYDDVHRNVGHPTVAILPAVLAVAEERKSTGAELLRALVAGAETAAIVGSWAAPSHYARGFHTTATIGSFGAAAAAGLLLGLNDRQMTMALGLAGTQAAGLKSMFGTMAKPFHAGKAASNGVLAAQLALKGVTAHPDVIGVEQGFLRTQSDGAVPVAFEAPRRGSEIVNTLFKYHAACYLTHSAIEAVRRIRERGIGPKTIRSVQLHVPKTNLAVCNIPSPQTGLETKFSLRHMVACAALGRDTAAIGTYSDANAIEPELVALRERVVVHGDHRDGTGARVVVAHAEGSAEMEFDVGTPDTDLDRQGRRLRQKFESLAAPALRDAEAARALADGIEQFERQDDVSAMLARAAIPA
jgi:2-methylcitrate dehydratase PrpD